MGVETEFKVNYSLFLCMDISIPTAGLEKEFKGILNDSLNKRIILSGIFGIGKTTFIKTFFDKHSADFESIKLFPVNYSVASNEDIFELIKYDILYELLQKNPQYERVDVKWFETLYFLSFEDIKEAVGKFVSLIPKVGKSIREIGSALVHTVKVFEEKKDKLQRNDLGEIMKFAKDIENSPGGIYENDFYTQLIESLVASLKVKNTGNIRKVVLVIDDLDRIDPEHIFRILNVFAAHFDHNSHENKFGIDKIILSCDIENVRKIFHNKYGTAVDFNGYIDKFFSKGIFYFRNRLNVIKSIPSILGTIQSVHSSFLFSSGQHYLKTFLYGLLNAFVNAGFLNLRMLTKFLNSRYDSAPRRVVTLNADANFTIRNFRIMLVFEFLVDLFGSRESLTQAIQQIDFELTFKEHDEKRIMGDLLYVKGWSGNVRDGSDKMVIRVMDNDIVFSVGYETLADRTNIFHAVYLPSENHPLEGHVHKTILLDALNLYGIVTSDE